MDDRDRRAATTTRRAGLADELLGPLLHKAWWALALRGLLGIVLGIVAISWPGVTFAVLLAVLGVYLMFDGILALVTTFRAAREHRTWWPYLIEGLVSIAVGLLAFTRPVATAFAILILVAVRSLVTGIVEIATGISMRRETGRSEWPLWLAGVLSLAFGGLLLVWPGVGLLTLVWLVGFYTITFGIILTATAFRLKGVMRRGGLTPHVQPS